MTRTMIAKRIAKTTLLYLALAVAVVVALPILAGLAYGIRLVIPVLIIAALVAVAFSPKVRQWFVEEADNQAAYHGLAYPTSSLFAHPGHTWANITMDGSATIGADALALAVLGPIGSVETPAAGAKIEQGQPLFTLVRGERRLTVKAPVSGVVAEVHQQTVEQPATLGNSPYGAGWVVKLEEVVLGKERGQLLRGQSMRRWFRAEVDRLTAMLAPAWWCVGQRPVAVHRRRQVGRGVHAVPGLSPLHLHA
jgi:glycine cleavage system H protein